MSINILIGIIISFMVVAPVALVLSSRLDQYARQKLFTNIKIGCGVSCLTILLLVLYKQV